jgi:hypothetical protein
LAQYILGIVIVIGFGVVGLTWWLIASVIKWSFDTPWLVVFVFNVFIILIEVRACQPQPQPCLVLSIRRPV